VAETAQASSGGHAAYENAPVSGMRLHANPVSQQRSAGERAGGIDGDDPDCFVIGAKTGRQTVHQGALAGAGRAGYSDNQGGPCARMQNPDDLAAGRCVVLDECQRFSDCCCLARNTPSAI